MNKLNISGIKYGFFLVVFFILPYFAEAAGDEFIMQAMRDEIKRTMNELHVESLKKPYYVEYTLKIRDFHTIKASLGSLLESNSFRNAVLSTDIRVGNYKFDNTNFFDFGFTFFGTGDDEESFKNRVIPIELDYATLRRELWLATDAAYKQSAEALSKKEATLKNRMRKDTTHDFLRLAPEKSNNIRPIPVFDANRFEQAMQSVSAVFSNYPKINISSAGIEYLPETVYYVNSEGREYIRTDYYAGIEIVASTQCDDGMPVANSYTVYSLDPKDLPSNDSLVKAAKLVASKLNSITAAPVLDEPYSGPVLYEGEAAAQIFAQVFAPNLATQRAAVTEQGMQESDRHTAFQSKIGGRVLPEFMNVKATPSMGIYQKTNLVGSYKIDDEGVDAQDVQLVTKGYLKNLLSSRVPTRRVRETNGHQRGGAAMISVISLESDKAHSKTPKALKERLLKMCKDRELPFGIIVRKVMDQNILFTTLFRMTRGEFPTPQGNSAVPILEAYKIFPDGREELIRGVNANGLTVQSFKDLLLTGTEPYALNYLAPAITSPFVSGGSQYISSSVIVADLLFEDGEIKPIEDDFPKPPLMQSPLSGN